MTDTAFVIVTYQSEIYIRKAIDSIQLYEPTATIIVVDNGSSDQTIDIVSGFTGVILLSQEGNLGFGKANNIGIKYALDLDCEYIYLLNHDAYLIEPVLNRLKMILQCNSDIGVISPFQMQPESDKLEIQFEKFLFIDGIISDYIADLRSHVQKSFYKVNFIQAASWFVPARVFNFVGGFDPIFFHYGEDNNFLNRLKFHGFTAAVVPGLRVCHFTNSKKINYNDDFGAYHIMRQMASHLSEFTDINYPFSSRRYLLKILNSVKSIIKSLFLFQFNRAFGQLVFCWMIVRLYRNILDSREITAVRKGCYL